MSGADRVLGWSTASAVLGGCEGQGLRGLRSLLFDKDQSRTFGGLRRVQAATGDFLWVRPDHYRGYDPGLPVIP
jgi:internalin A